MTFYERLAKLCEQRGFKPQNKAFRDAVGVSSGTITGWKNGALPRTEILLRLADYFSVSQDYLLGIEEPQLSHDTVSDNILMFALFGDDTEITESDLNDVKAFAEFVKQRRHAQKK